MKYDVNCRNALFIYYRLSLTFLLTLIKVCFIISMASRFLNGNKNTNTQKTWMYQIRSKTSRVFLHYTI